MVREGLEFGVLNRDLAVGGQRLDLRGLRGDYTDIVLPLFGAYQASNAAVALAAVEAFAPARRCPGSRLSTRRTGPTKPRAGLRRTRIPGPGPR